MSILLEQVRGIDHFLIYFEEQSRVSTLGPLLCVLHWVADMNTHHLKRRLQVVVIQVLARKTVTN